MPVETTRHDAKLAARWTGAGLWSDVHVSDLLSSRPDSEDHRAIVIDDEVRLSRSEMGARVARVAAALQSLGVVPGDVVASQLPNWWEAPVLAHASFRIGAVFCPLLPQLRERELSHALADSGARVLALPDSFRGRRADDVLRALDQVPPVTIAVRPSQPEVRAATCFDDLLEFEPAWNGGRFAADAPCLLLYTSGTESAAKGVVHTSNTLLSEATTVSAAHALDAGDALLLAAPMSHVGGFVYGALVPLIADSKVVLLDVWDAGRAVDLMEAESVTFFSAVPFFVRSVLALGRDLTVAASTMRLVAMGGSQVTPQDVREASLAFDCQAKRSYGLTELPTLTTGPSSADEQKLATTDGYPIAPAEVRIVDRLGRVVLPGVTGEIVCIGPEMFQGYRDASLNQSSFTSDGWFRTGDLGSVDAEGFLSVTGRIKDVIIRGGENYSPEEVERLLARHPRVRDVAVVGYPDDLYGERACAFVVAEGDLTLVEVASFLRTNGLASFKLPERLELRSELPSTGTGKVRKAVLRAEALDLLSTHRAEDASRPIAPR